MLTSKKYAINYNIYNLTPNDIDNIKIIKFEGLRDMGFAYNAAKGKYTYIKTFLSDKDDNVMKDSLLIEITEEDNKINYYATCCSGICEYVFYSFLNPIEIDNESELSIQKTLLCVMNKLIKEGFTDYTQERKSNE